MAITNAMCTSFKIEILDGIHAFGPSVVRAATTADSFRIGLYSSAASLDAATTAYTNTNEITGTGYTNTGVQSTTGQNLAVSQIPIAGPTTTAYVNFTNPQWTGATFSADGALIWNSTQSGKSVAALSFGGTKTVSSGTFTIQMPTAGTGSSILQIA
jgi:hypothetical protein